MRYLVFALALLAACQGGNVTSRLFHEPCVRADGLDVKAVQHEDFPTDVLPVALSGLRCTMLSFPWHTFGTSAAALDAYLASGEAEEVFFRIDLFDATCLRHPELGCHDGNFFQGQTPSEANFLIEQHDAATLDAFRARVREIRDYVLGASGPTIVTPIVSVGLEYNLSDLAVSILLELVEAEWPGVATLSNPVAGVRSNAATHHEIHGEDVSCGGLVDVVSQDGAASNGPLDDGRFLRDSGPNCFSRLLWRPEWQGRDKALSPTTIPPRERTISFTRETALEVNAALRAAQ